MLQLRPLTTSVLVAAVAFGLALMTPAAFAEDAKAPPQKNAKVAAKSTKAHGAKSKGKTPADTESKSDATKTPSSDKE